MNIPWRSFQIVASFLVPFSRSRLIFSFPSFYFTSSPLKDFSQFHIVLQSFILVLKEQTRQYGKSFLVPGPGYQRKFQSYAAWVRPQPAVYLLCDLEGQVTCLWPSPHLHQEGTILPITQSALNIKQFSNSCLALSVGKAVNKIAAVVTVTRGKVIIVFVVSSVGSAQH